MYRLYRLNGMKAPTAKVKEGSICLTSCGFREKQRSRAAAFEDLTRPPTLVWPLPREDTPPSLCTGPALRLGVKSALLCRGPGNAEPALVGGSSSSPGSSSFSPPPASRSTLFAANKEDWIEASTCKLSRERLRWAVDRRSSLRSLHVALDRVQSSINCNQVAVREPISKITRAPESRSKSSTLVCRRVQDRPTRPNPNRFTNMHRILLSILLIWV